MTHSPSSYACLYAREFPAQAMLRLHPHLKTSPYVVLEGEPSMQRVCSLNSAARKLGLLPGMTQAEVDNFSTVRALVRSLAEEENVKAILLECVSTFSARVEDQSKDGEFLCIVDIAGTERLFGTPSDLAKSLLDQVRLSGVAASVVLSSNFHTAICVARSAFKANITIVSTGTEGAALSPLPIAVLGLSDEQMQTFSSWGISTLGMLATLPESDLIARIGQEGKRLRQLSRGEMCHMFCPIEPIFTLEERFELDSPVDLLEPLLVVLAVMLDRLILRATSRVVALAAVTIALYLEAGGSHPRTVRVALPTNDRQLWITLIHLDLEAKLPGSPILKLSLTAETGPIDELQFGLFSPQLPEPGRLDMTMARIRAIVGEKYVGHAVLNDTHEPDGFRIEPFIVPPLSTSTEAAPLPCRSALRRLRPSENVTLTLRGEQPETFCFRGAHYTVNHAYGPWKTSGRWWTAESTPLEQWDIVAKTSDGTALCCCLVRDLANSRELITALYD